MKLGLGCNTLGSASHPLSKRRQIRLVREAIDLGFTVFDTADAYGNGESERTLGAAIRPSDDVIVATKVGYHFAQRGPAARLARRAAARSVRNVRPIIDRVRPGEGPRSGAFAATGGGGGAYASQSFDRRSIDAAVEGCLRRLARETLDVVLLHGPPRLELDALQALATQRDRGSISRIGVGAENDESALSWVGVDGVEIVEFGTRIGSAEPSATLASYGRSLWVRGLIRGGRGADNAEQESAIARLAADCAMSPLALDVGWVRDRTSAEVILVGASSSKNLRSIAAAHNASAVPADALDELERIRSHA